MKHFKNILAAAAIALAAISADAQTPKYIFYYIGDGMGMGPVMAAQTYNRVIRGAEQPLLMMQFPTVAWCQTWSASSTTTDSAAAGTALSTGTKTRNGMLGMGPDTIPATSVATILHDQGWGVGITTNVSADDATPGAFYAHVPNRGMSYEIDCEAARSGYEFLAGAGLRGLTGDHHDEIIELMQQNDVQMLYGRQGADMIDSRRVCLLNTETGHVWNVGYTIDSVATRLDLPLIASTCLAHLEKYSPDRFFMMVEGGNIDHALHANDGGAAIKEIINFDEALRVAYDFYLQHPDETLIIVTADHDTGGLALGNDVIKYASNLAVFDHQRKSKEAFSEECKAMLRDRRVYTWDDMRQKLSDDFGLFTAIPVTEKQEQALKDKFTATFELRNSEDQKTLYANFDAFSVAVLRLINDAAGIGFTTTSHTGNPVPLFAIGVGADLFRGLNNNSDIAPAILRLTGAK
ncbi:MAG: alkaline phosphatase [Muribaculaceae bacterium]|nr:alkaline phosphatase [Muribaculaceae bacterium]MDE6487639.1 alkaline phosphatase [Muribaculaceae bacterium]